MFWRGWLLCGEGSGDDGQGCGHEELRRLDAHIFWKKDIPNRVVFGQG